MRLVLPYLLGILLISCSEKEIQTFEAIVNKPPTVGIELAQVDVILNEDEIDTLQSPSIYVLDSSTVRIKFPSLDIDTIFNKPSELQLRTDIYNKYWNGESPLGFQHISFSMIPEVNIFISADAPASMLQFAEYFIALHKDYEEHIDSRIWFSKDSGFTYLPSHISSDFHYQNQYTVLEIEDFILVDNHRVSMLSEASDICKSSFVGFESMVDISVLMSGVERDSTLSKIIAIAKQYGWTDVNYIDNINLNITTDRDFNRFAEILNMVKTTHTKSMDEFLIRKYGNLPIEVIQIMQTYIDRPLSKSGSCMPPSPGDLED